MLFPNVQGLKVKGLHGNRSPSNGLRDCTRVRWLNFFIFRIRHDPNSRFICDVGNNVPTSYPAIAQHHLDGYYYEPIDDVLISLGQNSLQVVDDLVGVDWRVQKRSVHSLRI